MFQSLIWVACPTGLFRPTAKRSTTCFNPSYGLHALRARARLCKFHACVSFNPSYGLHALRASFRFEYPADMSRFNPSYGLHALRASSKVVWEVVLEVSIPHMGCMPYGQIVPFFSSGIFTFQSLIWVACPTGSTGSSGLVGSLGFNPSYGLHALRADNVRIMSACQERVSIPHMGCMPYGRWRGKQGACHKIVSIPHMGCMPYGPRTIESIARS